MQTLGARRLRIKRAAADEFLDDRALLFVAEIKEARLGVDLEEVGVCAGELLRGRAQRRIAGEAAVLPLPDMGDLMRQQHRGDQPDAVRVIGQVVFEIPILVEKHVIKERYGGGFRSHGFAHLWRQDQLAASGARARLAGEGDGAGGGAIVQADAVVVNGSAVDGGEVGAFVLRQRSAAGGEEKEKEEGADHGGS